MSRWALALGAGSLIGVALGGVVFIIAVEICDGRQEVAW